MILLWLIFLPLFVGLLSLFLPKKLRGLAAILTSLVLFVITLMIFKREIYLLFPWCGYGLEFSLRLYNFSAFILLSVVGFSFLVALYSSALDLKKEFFPYLLLTVSFSAGAVLANNLILLLFFWEGLLLTLFGMIVLGREGAIKTAVKAFIIIGIAELCMLLGVALTGHLAGTFSLSDIKLAPHGLAGLAFILLLIGALAKGGAMPFHGWIPDAAFDAPLPFMALIPGAIEKLLGIYFMTRISLDLFKLDPHSNLSLLMMVLGAVTILFAVMMALIQKDFKKLLSFHAISQVGYMVLGIGTAVPAGIVGGIFHMINNALYKSCLFLTGGAVEKQAGTADLSKLGGLAWKMPVTFACFVVAAVSISGVPPFNGFFSKELIYAGALERGWIFYLVAITGSFFTAASFLKLGHAAFLGKAQSEVKEAPWPMLLPMVVIAVICVLFGVYNAFPIKELIQPVLGERLEGHSFSGMPTNMLLVIVTLIVLAAAVLNHLWGVKRTGKGLGAVDHIHYAPGLSQIYDQAEKGRFDPYDIGMSFAKGASWALYFVDRFVDWIYDVFIVRSAFAFTCLLKWAHSGNYSVYVLWSLVGTLILFFYAVR